jgi:hypothetical protein
MTIGMIVNTNMLHYGSFISVDTAAIPVRCWHWVILAECIEAVPNY